MSIKIETDLNLAALDTVIVPDLGKMYFEQIIQKVERHGHCAVTAGNEVVEVYIRTADGIGTLPREMWPAYGIKS